MFLHKLGLDLQPNSKTAPRWLDVQYRQWADTQTYYVFLVLHNNLFLYCRTAVCQLMNKRSRESEEMEAFNRYDERLLEDLAVYCGLALQYAQAVQITEERRASIEVTQEVGSSLKLPASPAYSLGNPIQMFRCDRCVCVCSLWFLQVLAYHITAAEQEIQALQVIPNFLWYKWSPPLSSA